MRLARLPPPASRVRRSRRLRDTLAAAPGLLAHALVTETVKYSPMGPELRYAVVLGGKVARDSTHGTSECREGMYLKGDDTESPQIRRVVHRLHKHTHTHSNVVFDGSNR